MRRVISLYLLSLFAAPAAWACAGLQIADVWVRETPPGVNVAAAYMKLINPSDKTIYITGISSPDFARVEFHSMTMANGSMHMEELKKISIAPHSEFALQPDGSHAMLFNPRGMVSAGKVVSFELTCSTGPMQFKASIRRSGFPEADMIHEHHQ